MVNGKVVRSATGDNDEYLEDKEWDVSALQGRTAYFRIIDQATGGWGHILVDGIGFAGSSLQSMH